MVCNTTGGSPWDASKAVEWAERTITKQHPTLIVDVFVTTEEIAAAIRRQTPIDAAANSDPLAILTGIPLESYPTVTDAVARAKELRKLRKHVVLLIT